MDFENTTQLNDWLESTPLATKINWLQQQNLARNYSIPQDDAGREFLRHEIDRSIREQFPDLPYAQPDPEPEQE